MDSKRLPESKKNNLWFRYTNHDTVIVFVHGVLSDSRGCWLYTGKTKGEANAYWPELIENDSRFGDLAIYLGGYYTDVDAEGYKISHCAVELLGALRHEDHEGHPPVMDKKKILFVCHSTGGIVARYMIEDKRERFRDKQIGLVLVASPSNGSRIATSIDALLWYFNHGVGKQLKWGNESLEDLDDKFRDLVNDKYIPNLSGIEFYENHFITQTILPKWARLILPRIGLRIVPKESAGRYFGRARQIPDSDHFSICKPKDKTATVHEYLFYFSKDNQFTVSDSQPPIPALSSNLADSSKANSEVIAPIKPVIPAAPDALVVKILEKLTDLDKLEKYGKEKTEAGRWADAQQVYQKFVKLARDSDRTRYIYGLERLGECRWKLGDQEGAKQFWSDSLRLTTKHSPDGLIPFFDRLSKYGLRQSDLSL
jgi:hypothetical protein